MLFIMEIFVTFVFMAISTMDFSFFAYHAAGLKEWLWSAICAAIFDTLKEPIIEATSQTCSRCVGASANNTVTLEQFAAFQKVVIEALEAQDLQRQQADEDKEARREQQVQIFMQETSAMNKRLHAVECRTAETRRQCEEGRREGRHPTMLQKDHNRAMEALKAKHATVLTSKDKEVADLKEQLEAAVAAKKASYSEPSLSQAKPEGHIVSNSDSTASTLIPLPHSTTNYEDGDDRTGSSTFTDNQCGPAQVSKVIAPEGSTNDAAVDKLVSSLQDEDREREDVHKDTGPALKQSTDPSVRVSDDSLDHSSVVPPAGSEASETPRSETPTSLPQPFSSSPIQLIANINKDGCQQSVGESKRDTTTETRADQEDAGHVTLTGQTDGSEQTTVRVITTPDKPVQLRKDSTLSVNPVSDATSSSDKRGGRRAAKSLKSPQRKSPSRLHQFYLDIRSRRSPKGQLLPNNVDKQAQKNFTKDETVADSSQVVACGRPQEESKDVNVPESAPNIVSSPTSKKTEPRSDTGSSDHLDDTERTPEYGNSHGLVILQISDANGPNQSNAASEQGGAMESVAETETTVDHLSRSETIEKEPVIAVTRPSLPLVRPELPLANSISEMTRMEESGRLDYEYREVFPQGHVLVETSSHKLLCGTDALCKSSQRQHSLLLDIEDSQLMTHLQAAGVQGTSNFADEELAKLLFHLGRDGDKVSYLGIYCNEQPQKIIYRTRDADAPEYQVIWISNDMKGTVPGRMGHWSAMAPKQAADADVYNASAAGIESKEVDVGSIETTSAIVGALSDQTATASNPNLGNATAEVRKSKRVTFSADCKGPETSGFSKKVSRVTSHSIIGGLANARVPPEFRLDPEPQQSLATSEAERIGPTNEPTADFQGVDSMEGLEDSQDRSMATVQISGHVQSDPSTTTWQSTEPHSLDVNTTGQDDQQTGFVDNAQDFGMDYAEIAVHKTDTIQLSTPLGERGPNTTDTTEDMQNVSDLPPLPANPLFDHSHQPTLTEADVAMNKVLENMTPEQWQSFQQFIEANNTEDGYISSGATPAASTGKDVQMSGGEISEEALAALLEDAVAFVEPNNYTDAPLPSQDATTASSGQSVSFNQWDFAADTNGVPEIDGQVGTEGHESRLDDGEISCNIGFDVLDNSDATSGYHYADTGEVPDESSTEVENGPEIAGYGQMNSSPFSMQQTSPAYTQWQAPPSPRPSMFPEQSHPHSVDGEMISPPFIPGLMLTSPRPTNATSGPKPDSPPSPVLYSSDYDSEEEEETSPLPEEVADRLRQKRDVQVHVTFYQSVLGDEEKAVRTGKNAELSRMVCEEARTNLEYWSADLSRVKQLRYEKKDQSHKGHTEYISIKREVDDVDLRKLRAQLNQTAQARFDAAQWQARLEDEETPQSPALSTPRVSPMPPPPSQSGFVFQTQTQISFSAEAAEAAKMTPRDTDRKLRFVKIGGEEDESSDNEAG